MIEHRSDLDNSPNPPSVFTGGGGKYVKLLPNFGLQGTTVPKRGNV